jgi:hypothetical protein
LHYTRRRYHDRLGFFDRLVAVFLSVRLFDGFFTFFAATFFFDALAFVALVDFAGLAADFFKGAGNRFATAFFARLATALTAVSASVPAA